MWPPGWSSSQSVFLIFIRQAGNVAENNPAGNLNKAQRGMTDGRQEERNQWEGNSGPDAKAVRWGSWGFLVSPATMDSLQSDNEPVRMEARVFSWFRSKLAAQDM